MQKEADEPRGDSILKRFATAFRTNRKLELSVYGGIVLIILSVYLGGAFGKSEHAEDDRINIASNAESELDAEQRLKTVLSCIRGAGQVEVMITYDTSGEIITAMSTSRNINSAASQEGEHETAESQETTTEAPATVSDGNRDTPIILMEKQPVIRGVIVVAEGAADIAVKLDLERAVRAVLDVPLSKIEVFELGAQVK